MPLDNFIGGAGAAPGSYHKVGAVSTLKLVSGSTTVDAVRLTVQEDMFGVVFSFTVPRTLYDGLGWDATASAYTAIVQQYGEYEGTVGVIYVPDTNGSGNLIDTLIVTVGTPDGLVAVDVQVPLSPTNLNTNFNKVVAAYTAAIAGLVAVQ